MGSEAMVLLKRIRHQLPSRSLYRISATSLRSLDLYNKGSPQQPRGPGCETRVSLTLPPPSPPHSPQLPSPTSRLLPTLSSPSLFIPPPLPPRLLPPTPQSSHTPCGAYAAEEATCYGRSWRQGNWNSCLLCVLPRASASVERGTTDVQRDSAARLRPPFSHSASLARARVAHLPERRDL